MVARQRSGCDRIAIFIKITMEHFQLLDFVSAQNLAAIRLIAVVPLKLGSHPVVHTDVEIAQHDNGRL